MAPLFLPVKYFLPSHTLVSGWLVRRTETLELFYVNGITLMSACLNDYYLGSLHLAKMMDQSQFLQMQPCLPDLTELEQACVLTFRVHLS